MSRKKTAAIPPSTDIKNVLGGPPTRLERGGTIWQVAPQPLRQMAQGLIDAIPEHRHLKNARILLLVRWSKTAAKKIEAGERVTLGRAAKTSAVARLLTLLAEPMGEAADFVVWLAGENLDRVAEIDREVKAIGLVGADPSPLIDHELSHCGAKVIGKFVEAEKLDAFKNEKAGDFIEEVRDVTDDAGRILCRFYARDKEGGYIWQLRRHDLEEFNGVADRHGRWDRQVGRFCDCVEQGGSAQPTLFDAAESQSQNGKEATA